MTTWGLCATIRAPLEDILHFAAFHLEAGAHRLDLYLDDDNRVAVDALSPHPKVHVTLCDADYWGGKRPVQHQARQTANATRTYRKKADVDWLIHMDVDEILVSDRRIAGILDALPPEMPVTRIRPMEMLSDRGTAFKAFIPSGPDRDRIVQDLYPTFGIYLRGGFLSHLAGKVFVRTGFSDIAVRIHNVLQEGEILRGHENQPGIDLAHCHAKTWDHWRAAFDYRFEKGSYRAELGPNRPRDKGGLSTHELLEMVTAERGEAGLRAFFEEVSADTPRLRRKLEEHGLLRRANLDLNDTIAAHFPWLTR